LSSWSRDSKPQRRTILLVRFNWWSSQKECIIKEYQPRDENPHCDACNGFISVPHPESPQRTVQSPTECLTPIQVSDVALSVISQPSGAIMSATLQQMLVHCGTVLCHFEWCPLNQVTGETVSILCDILCILPLITGVPVNQQINKNIMRRNPKQIQFNFGMYYLIY
jgi:hypothetical protein